MAPSDPSPPVGPTGRPQASRDSDRRRVPQPWLSYRIPSGRGATEQPNAGNDGPAALTLRFWVLVIAVGIAAGLFADLLMLVLHGVQHLAFQYVTGPFAHGAARATPARRFVVLSLAGLFAGVAWYCIRRWHPGQSSEVHDTLWSGEGNLSFRRSFLSSVCSEVIVGMGASLGREAAPQLMGAASGSALAHWARLSEPQRRLLLACGAGAGLAAVYNVPLGGALLTAELLFGQITLAVTLPALACSVVATVTAWLYLPNQPTYLHIPAYHVTTSQLVWAIVAGPVIGMAAVAWVRLVAWVTSHRPSGLVLLVAPLGAFMVLAAAGWPYPQLLGNGKGIAQDAFVGHAALLTLGVLLVLKPLVTVLCLGSGASGGLFTPTLSTGAALGGALGLVWSSLWPGAPAGSYAIIAAAAMIGAAMQAPVAGLVIMLELTQTSLGLAVPMVIATVTASVVARYADGYSIYSARLPGQRRAAQRREAQSWLLPGDDVSPDEGR